MGKYTNNPKAGGAGAGAGGDEEEEDGDGGQSSHFTVGAIKMISMRQSAAYQYVLQFFEYTGCGAENQQRQKDKVKLFKQNSNRSYQFQNGSGTSCSSRKSQRRSWQRAGNVLTTQSK